MARKRTRKSEYVPPAYIPGEDLSFINEEEFFPMSIEGQDEPVTFSQLGQAAPPLSGTKSQYGAYDPFNPFRYLTDYVAILKGYKSAFEKGEAIFASFSFGPESITLNGQIDTKVLAEAFAGIDSKAAARLKKKVTAGKYKIKGRELSASDLRLILNAIQEVFGDDNFHKAITDQVKKMYDAIMKPEIARNTPDSMKRGGGSGGMGASSSINEDTDSDDEDGGNKRRKRKKFWSDSMGGGKATYFTRYWQSVKQILTRSLDESQAKTVATGSGNFTTTIAPFSIKDLLAVQIGGTRSRFKSMYLMAEFGTGAFAYVPRPYKSRKATPFKLSPPLVALFQRTGIGATPFSWSTNAGILAMLGNDPKAKGTPVNVLNEFSSIYAQRKRAKGAYNRQKQIEAYQKRLHRFASYVFGKKDPTSMAPGKILFDRRGVVKNVREAYKQYLIAIGKNIDFDIQARVRAKLASYGQSTMVKGKKVYVSPLAKDAATLSKLFPKDFIKLTLPESIFDLSSYKAIQDQLKKV